MVYDLFWGIFKPRLFRLALQLDLFTPLAAGEATAEQVAQSCHCHSAGIKHLLDYLCSLHVLERHEDLYALTPRAATFLDRGGQAYASFSQVRLLSERWLTAWPHVWHGWHLFVSLLPEATRALNMLGRVVRRQVGHLSGSSNAIGRLLPALAAALWHKILHDVGVLTELGLCRIIAV
jgi:hypothetical protein